MRRSSLTRTDFPASRLLVGFEGGAIYNAERDGKFYIIQDESTIADFLSDEDLRDLTGSLVIVLEFDTADERNAYIQKRGWGARAEDQRWHRGI